MFNIGDVIIYSVHGLSQIDDICEKTFSNVTKKYYVLHPLENLNLTISTPVDNDKVVMLKMMDEQEAEEILQSFNQPGISWIADTKQRLNKYRNIINAGNRRDIAKVANTLMRKDLELKLEKKKMYEQDKKMLSTIQGILFKELEVALHTTFENISGQVENLIKA